MPVVEVHILEGYEAEVRQRLCRALGDAVRQVMPAPPEAITVMAHEMPSDNYLRGGVRRSPAAALPDPVEVVRDFLSAMQARDLELARSLLGEGFVMQFPGTGEMRTLEELIAWSKPRYRDVSKVYDGFDVAMAENVVVYARGTLQGAWPDGTAFDGIRFIDRFELSGGRIVRQDVWNDMAETRS